MNTLYYIANIRLPTEKAHGIQIMEMCQAFAGYDLDVTLVVPKRHNSINKDAFAYYGISPNFRIVFLSTLDTVSFGPLGAFFQSIVFFIHALFFVLKRPGIIYSRDKLFLFLLSFFSRGFVYEVHAPNWGFVTRRVFRMSLFQVLISRGLERYFSKKGIPANGMIVAPDGVNMARFANMKDRDSLRSELGLPLGKKIVLYSGHLYPRKGAGVLALAMREFGEDVLGVFVGGTRKETEDFSRLHGHLRNVLILGHRAYQDIPLFLRSADILVLPNSANDDDSRVYTSPMKLFEYMASGTTIVASDVPSLKEVLTEETAFFAVPDDSKSFADVIRRALADPLCNDVAIRALSEVERYSWSLRAGSIIERMRQFAS